MNQVNLIGRITKEIEVRYTAQTQTAVCRFTLAVNRRKKDEADFISCQAWGKTAELMEKYVKKGDRIRITGRIETGSYEKDGKKVYTTDVIVEELEFLNNKGDGKPQEAQEATKSAPDGFQDLSADEYEGLPF